jgi:hypothetical protein
MVSLKVLINTIDSTLIGKANKHAIVREVGEHSS